MDEPQQAENQQASKPQPTTLVIFGSTGNLAQIKLLPALYHLLKANRLPDDFKIIGIARDGTSVESLMQQTEITLLRKEHDCDSEVLKKLGSIMQMIKMDSTFQDDYHHLKSMLDEIDNLSGVKHNRLYYLAIPPNIFRSVLSCLSNAGLNDQSSGIAQRILVEKPFGTDLQSARDLVSFMSEHFHEDQVYRIDHYLAKETAQNILVFRFNNPLIDDIWGRQFIDHIQITAAEMIGIEGRAAFYEGMGAMRDIVQSHLLQLMALIMMEVPQPITAADIHREKLALLQSIESIKPQHVDEVTVRGQYDGYLDEVQNPESKIETFAALKLEVSNSRWGGVPVLLRTGKALASKVTEITVVFKDRSRRSAPANLLTIRIQPNEGISLQLTAKKPGFTEELQPVQMDFCYQSSFEDGQPDAYERVLMDAIIGDQSLFASSEEVIRCWEILEPVLDRWHNGQDKPPVYEKGSWGPNRVDELAAEYGIEWLSDQVHVCPIHPPNK